MTSYVYFIRPECSNKEPMKIGKSNNPDKRLEELQTGNPLKLQVVFLLECETEERAYKIESYLHHKLRKYRMSGEWFRHGNWYLKPLLDSYSSRMDMKFGGFKQIETELSKLKKENKELKRTIKELESQIDSELDSLILKDFY